MDEKEIIAPHLKAYDQDKFIEKVRRIIADAGTKQAYVARIVGRDPGNFSRAMNHEFDFSLNDAAALHRAFDVDLNNLIADDTRYDFYCSTDKTNVDSFDAKLGDLLVEIDRVRGTEQDRRIGLVLKALALRHGVGIED